MNRLGAGESARLACIVPDWPAPAGVSAVFTLRGRQEEDGASRGYWAYFNLGAHVGDDAEAVRANRSRLQQVLGMQAVFLQQVHATEVVRLHARAPGRVPVADAAWTTASGLACTVMVADCLPILLTDQQGHAVAAAHAGWRGLAAGIVEQTVWALQGSLGDPDGSPLMAWLGPCIGPRVFEVGAEVRRAFVADDEMAGQFFRPLAGGKFMANLPGLARRRLNRLGVNDVHGNDGSPEWCTVSCVERFFSYRRDRRELAATGRMAACIWRD